MTRCYTLPVEPNIIESKKSLINNTFEFCVGGKLTFGFAASKTEYFINISGEESDLDNLEDFLNLSQYRN